MDELEKSFAKSNQENQSMKNDLEEQYKALMQLQTPVVVEEQVVQQAMDNPQAFIIESREQIMELQMQMRLANDRAELMRKEMAINRKENIDEHNQLIFK